VTLTSGASHVVVHVPHGSPLIPEDVRADLAVDESSLAFELAAMTDWLTDSLARAAVEALPAGCPPPHVWTNPWSRLVVDPERFPDEREEMNTVGMGAVYTARQDGSVLRTADAARDQRLVQAYFSPYAEGLGDLVQRVLDEHGAVVIVDLHSFPSAALPYELLVNGPRARPELCIGTDPLHTPAGLVEVLTRHWEGDVAVDAPFSGSYVPLRHHGVERRVSSVMIELRRDVVHRVFDDPHELLASGLLPEEPWRERPDSEPGERVVRYLAGVLAELSQGAGRVTPGRALRAQDAHG